MTRGVTHARAGRSVVLLYGAVGLAAITRPFTDIGLDLLFAGGSAACVIAWLCLVWDA